jgi:two-component system, response regulator
MRNNGKSLDRAAHILLIEDNRMDIELTLDAFRERRLQNEIHVATGGQQGLDYLFGHGKHCDREAYPLPDLILLDLKMPVIDGHEVLRQIKHDEHLKTIPVIVLTSSQEEVDRAISYANGANSYLVKPVSFEGFMGVVQQIDSYWLTLNVPPPFEYTTQK